jgi:hypothetical protein
LDPKLFDTTQPEGYTNYNFKMPSLEKLVDWITEALKIYAEQNDGHYPQVKTVYAEVANRDIDALIGHEGEPTQEEMRSEKYKKAMSLETGFSWINILQVGNPDFTYNGKTVGPNDKDKVLVRWKLDDGRYEVIFGDLRAETVTAEKLHALEGK